MMKLAAGGINQNIHIPSSKNPIDNWRGANILMDDNNKEDISWVKEGLIAEVSV